MDEWRKAYINYRGLKKLIKRVNEHYEARQNFEMQRGVLKQPQPARTQAARLLRRSTDVFRKSHRVPNYGSTEEQPGIPPVTLDGTGLTLPNTSKASQDDVESRAEVQPGSSQIAKDTSNGKSSPTFLQESRLSEEPASYAQEDPDTTHAAYSWSDRDPRTDHADLDKLISRLFDKEELKFFATLDEEVARIVHFYEEQEHEAIERLSTLVTQLSELSEHRRRFKAQTQKVVHRDGLSRIFSAVPRAMDTEELQRARLNAQHIANTPKLQTSVDEGDKRRAEAMEHMQALNIGPLQPNTTGGKPTERTKAVYDPLQYKAARKKLRSAVIENYRALEILNNYRILNRTGFTKILKKFDKTLHVEIMHPYYAKRVLPTPLVQSESVPKMLHATEGR